LLSQRFHLHWLVHYSKPCVVQEAFWHTFSSSICFLQDLQEVQDNTIVRVGLPNRISVHQGRRTISVANCKGWGRWEVIDTFWQIFPDHAFCVEMYMFALIILRPCLNSLSQRKIDEIGIY
jgi:hypothetical protein